MSNVSRSKLFRLMRSAYFNYVTSLYILNDGTEYYRGQNELVDVGIRDISQRKKGIGGMLRVR